MSNYPYGADDDPRAPWNQDPDDWYDDYEEEIYEEEVYDEE